MSAPALSQDALNLELGKYRHYKGGLYEVLGVAHHSESLEELVVYRALYGEGLLWIRPLKMFLEEVEAEGKLVPRFKYQSSAKSANIVPYVNETRNRRH